MMPSFLIKGAERSGTTSLHDYLHQHPDVYMTPAKEPKFFAFEGERVDFRGPGDRQAMTYWLTTTLDEYQALFAGVTTEAAAGETSPCTCTCRRPRPG
jgi:Sulfotransferase family